MIIDSARKPTESVQKRAETLITTRGRQRRGGPEEG
jgi:hypothetical protein